LAQPGSVPEPDSLSKQNAPRSRGAAAPTTDGSARLGKEQPGGTHVTRIAQLHRPCRGSGRHLPSGQRRCAGSARQQLAAACRHGRAAGRPASSLSARMPSPRACPGRQSAPAPCRTGTRGARRHALSVTYACGSGRGRPARAGQSCRPARARHQSEDGNEPTRPEFSGSLRVRQILTSVTEDQRPRDKRPTARARP